MKNYRTRGKITFMSIEADCFKVRRTKKDLLIKSTSVMPGSSEVVDYVEKVGILAICGLDNLSGTVLLKTDIKRVRNLSVILYENDNDDKGQTISSYDQPIKITGEQELSIFHKLKKKEVIIYLEREDNSKSQGSPLDLDRLLPIA